MKYSLLIFSLIVIVISSCADKTSLSDFPLTNTGGPPIISEPTYVQQYPVWGQFNQPEAVLLGREPLVYVADSKNNQLVQLDLSGIQQGVMPIRNPRAVAQDYNYSLLVIADTISPLFLDTISVLYRINLVPVGGLLSNASKIPLMTSDYPTPLSSRSRRFTGVGVFADNSYIVTRVGPDNTNTLDPDNALLKIYGIDSVTSVTSLSGFQVTGNGVYSIDLVSAVTTFTGNLTDFIITRDSPDFGFKVLWFVYDNVKGTYDPKFLPEDNVDILNIQIGTPEGVTVDNNTNIYVTDNSKDSLYKYSSTGKLKTSESFGGAGSNVNELNGPMGVSFFNKVLYIGDTENNRVVRYKLSTDIY